MAATRASGSGGGPWADPPRDTSRGTLSYDGPGLPSGPLCDAWSLFLCFSSLFSPSLSPPPGPRGAGGPEMGPCLLYVA